ncbi:MAG: hypothetical protein GY774_14445 [Planctomycetes bacterium]|nr:hypothetical protein [Planctomycetota bacterium]
MPEYYLTLTPEMAVCVFKSRLSDRLLIYLHERGTTMPAETPEKINPILLVNSKTAALMLGMSRSFFYAQVSTGRVPKPIKFGRKSLWPVESLRTFVTREIEKKTNG